MINKKYVIMSIGDHMSQFKDLLIKYKNDMNVTNDYIAEIVGVNKSTVSRWIKVETKVTKPEIM